VHHGAAPATPPRAARGPGRAPAGFEKLAACYRKAGVPDHVQTRLYDTPNEFNLEMQREAWTFLGRHLGRSA
jgi:hypothetical protein